MSFYGPALPARYFVTTGQGEANVTRPGDLKEQQVAYEANSYDAATVDAKIPHVNSVEYSSLLPPDAEESEIISLPWGSVVGMIKADVNGKKDDRLTAALFVVEVRFRNNNSWISPGKFVLEYGGHVSTLDDAYTILFRESLDMFRRRKWATFPNIEPKKMKQKTLYEEGNFSFQVVLGFGTTFICTKDHGTALAAVCIYEWKQAKKVE